MTTPNRLRGCRALALLALLGGMTSLTWAQRNPSGMPHPRLYQFSVAGAKAGSTVQLTCYGRHLDEPEKLSFSHPGIRAELVEAPVTPMPDGKGKGKGKQTPSEADVVIYKVTVPPEVPVGFYDVRFVGKYGVSNPRVFVVGDLAEVSEKEPNNDVDQAQKVELNSTINGTINTPTDVDYYSVHVKKGQRVVVACLTSSIDSRLQPQLEVYDKNDRQVALNRGYSDHDAVTDFVAAEDGDYLVRVYHFTHMINQVPGGLPNGASDHFYRLTLTTAPWIDTVSPKVIEPGKTTTVTLYGRNLPGGKVDPNARCDDSILETATLSVTGPADGKGQLRFSGTIPPASAWLDGFELRVKNGTGASNPVLLGLATAPVILENDSNDTPESAQQVALPCELAGRVDKRRDRDWYSFSAKKGEVWNIEVFSQRLGAPTYMMFLLRGNAGKTEIFESPLNENLNLYEAKFYTRSEDPPPYRFVVPADGVYHLLVVSRIGDTHFGPRHQYVVRITRDEPDFRLIAIPAADESPEAGQLGQGGQEAFTVLIQRSESFTGDVELFVEGLPQGLSCPPQILNGNVRKTTLVVSAAADAPVWTGEIRIRGKATIQGQPVVREARPGGIIWPSQPQQEIPTLSRLERGTWLAVRSKAPFTLKPTIDKTEILQGDKATVKVQVNRVIPDLKSPLQIVLMQSQNRQGSELPQNLRLNNNQPITINPDQKEGTLAVTVGNDVPPGTYNVVLRGQTQMPFAKNPMAQNRPNVNVVQPSEPLAITILPRSLAQLTLSTNATNLKLGGQSEVVVRVQRRFNYDGPFQVKLELPKEANGVSVEEVTIPAGQNEAKLILRASNEAKPGALNNLVVRATALFNGKSPIQHEAKLNVNVVK